MSITARWDNIEQTILILTFKGKWGIDNDFEQAIGMAQHVSHAVCAILDFRYSGRLPHALFGPPLPFHAMPPNVVAAIILGLKPISLNTMTIYAASMQEARRNVATLMEHAEVPANVDHVESHPDDPVVELLLQPFEQAQAINLISFEPNGVGAPTVCPFILHKQHLYLLISTTSAEFARIQANPYVKIESCDPDRAAGPLVALASPVPLLSRPHLIGAWDQKYKQRVALLGLRLVWLELNLP